MLELQSFKYFWSKIVAHDGKIKHPSTGQHGKTPEDYCYDLMRMYLFRDDSIDDCKLWLQRTDADLVSTALVSLLTTTSTHA